jgi:hypothetical protein
MVFFSILLVTTWMSSFAAQQLTSSMSLIEW